jgi:hypothetical protein
MVLMVGWTAKGAAERSLERFFLFASISVTQKDDESTSVDGFQLISVIQIRFAWFGLIRSA